MTYDPELIEELRRYFSESGLTVAVAESVTAGHLQAAFAAAADASEFFQGGVTVYNLGQKVRHLGIDPIKAERNNCVSQDVASQMALGVIEMFLSDVGIGITGFASTSREMKLDEVYAYFSIARGENVIGTQRITSLQADRFKVQIDYTNQVMRKSLEALKNDAK